MALVQLVENGELVESTSQSSLSSTSSTSNDTMDKEAFLQLLVAQMQYQDPLEPTSNTEYISQYAQFTQVEQMQNMVQSMDFQRASGLVGEEVYVKVTDSSGNTSYVQGKVDYVVYENGEAYVAIDESLYSLDDVDTVVDSEYLEAYNLAYEFASALNQLPSVNSIDLSDADDIDELEEMYNNMTDYQKTFVASDYVTTLEEYVEKLKEVRLAAEEAEEAEETDDVEDTSSDGDDSAE